VRMATLTREYNCKFRGQGYLNGKVKILHGHVEFKMPHDFLEKAAKALNASTRPRVYIAGRVYEQDLVGRFVDRRKARLVGRFPTLPEPELWAEARRLKQIIQQRGVRNMVTGALHGKSVKAG
jgi:hypothetical protein